MADHENQNDNQNVEISLAAQLQDAERLMGELEAEQNKHQTEHTETLPNVINSGTLTLLPKLQELSQSLAKANDDIIAQMELIQNIKTKMLQIQLDTPNSGKELEDTMQHQN